MKFLIIFLVFIILISIFSLTIPIKKEMVDDRYIYGDYFCNTHDGSCITTYSNYPREVGDGIFIIEESHSTQKKLAIFEYFKYINWKNKQEKKE